MKLENVIPTKLMHIKPTSIEDIDLIAQWFENGKCNEVSQKQVSRDIHSFFQYQESMQQSGWEYQCITIEDEKRIVGYLDYRYRNSLGEILGIYLDFHLRGQHIGQHLIRWIIADLRQRGCRELRIEIQANESAALNKFRSVDFRHDKTLDRIEDRTVIFTLSRPITPFLYLRPPNPAYTFLHSENIYLHHVALAEALSGAIQQLPGVEAILGLGSLARGFADQWSDLDLAVLGRGTGLKQLWKGERSLAGIDVDLFVIDLDTTPPSSWDDSRLQAYEESVILFARDTDIIKLLQQAVYFREDERTLKI